MFHLIYSRFDGSSITTSYDSSDPLSMRDLLRTIQHHLTGDEVSLIQVTDSDDRFSDRHPFPAIFRKKVGDPFVPVDVESIPFAENEPPA